MYYKNSKTQKTEENLKTEDVFQFHSCLKKRKINFLSARSITRVSKNAILRHEFFYLQDEKMHINSNVVPGRATCGA